MIQANEREKPVLRSARPTPFIIPCPALPFLDGDSSKSVGFYLLRETFQPTVNPNMFVLPTLQFFITRGSPPQNDGKESDMKKT